ncbi:MAG: galactose mutarotase [Clostridia bacterium]|nr:galactose mutarotase [Clostridia bacterium]MBQ9729153.1 galactose mutarotase [Clostridia bacterium]
MIKKTYSFEKDGFINDVYTLYSAKGCEADILTYGGHLIALRAPDKNGVLGDCIVGCKNPEDYYGEYPYFGATIGRYGNRIGGAKFTLNGKEYVLEANDKGNCLHGGITAPFNRQLWDAEIVGDNSLRLSLVSPDGAGGFPGELKVWVTYTLTDENELIIDYKAVSDQDTVCNLTNHSYFNIGSQDTVLSHELMINSKQITPVDEELIPHGEFMDIEGTEYSFLPAKTIGKDIASNAKWIRHCNGYDFNYCLEKKGEGLEHFAYVYDKESGRKMDCYTTLPGVQLYTACSTGGFQGKKNYVNHCALCLETQRFPNSPNCPKYPKTTLKAGEEYHEVTVYKFSVQ